jgi:hypothetical protein
MGFGKRKEDAVRILGYLKAMRWEREPLTEVQPWPDDAAPPPELNDQGTVKGAGDQDTK